jgi:hypothetical protein
MSSGVASRAISNAKARFGEEIIFDERAYGEKILLVNKSKISKGSLLVLSNDRYIITKFSPRVVLNRIYKSTNKYVGKPFTTPIHLGNKVYTTVECISFLADYQIPKVKALINAAKLRGKGETVFDNTFGKAGVCLVCLDGHKYVITTLARNNIFKQCAISNTPYWNKAKENE